MTMETEPEAQQKEKRAVETLHQLGEDRANTKDGRGVLPQLRQPKCRRSRLKHRGSRRRSRGRHMARETVRCL
uniref:Uncharacterized protein n=1 Tax=Arundo donax TaxID=35708 RepID=A0A0A9A1K2_ARUDO